MSRGWWVCVVCALCGYGAALVNGVLFILHGEAISLGAVVLCGASGVYATWVGRDVAATDRRIAELDRELRRYDR